MTPDELIKRLQGFEWNDAEFKKAQRGVPENAYETVSAFSNTSGGWLVFGVQEGADQYEIVGVVEVDKVQNDFLSVLRSGDKLNRVICVSESMTEIDDKTLLVFLVPEAGRQDKPIYLNNDIRRSFIRRGGCDERCTNDEIERFLRDGATGRHDGETIDLDPEHCFDSGSIEWYRRIFNERNPSADPTQSNVEFLNEWGLVIESDGELRPTRAAILLFGSNAAFRQCLPRPVLDCQWTNVDKEQVTPEQRWDDRLVAEFNLMQTWRTLVEKFMSHASTPFELDPATMRRRDAPPDYVAFREAAINLLIHQDYADHSRKGEICFFADRIEFWNPGDAFASTDQLLEPGEKEVRNPRVVAAFRRIGLSEQAGTGVRAIFHNWQRLGHVPPEIRNDKTEKAFGLVLLDEPLLSEEQILFQAQLGAHLTDPQAKVLAYASRRGRVRLVHAKMVTGLPGPGAQAILDQLVIQVLLASGGSGKSTYYSLAEHLIGRFPSEVATDQAATTEPRLVTDQPAGDSAGPATGEDGTQQVSGRALPASALKSLSETQWKIVLFCEAPRAMTDIMTHVGLTHRSFFKRQHLDPLIKGGVLQMKHPDNPNHPEQAYFLSETGVKLKALPPSQLEQDDDSEA